MTDKNKMKTRSTGDDSVGLSEELVNRICAKQASTIMDQIKPTINGAVMEVVQPIMDKMDDVLNKFAVVQSETLKQNSKIVSLERKYDQLEQYTRRNSLRIYGIPESTEEDTSKLVLQLFREKMKLDIILSHIDRSHRIGVKDNKKTKSRAIIVKFVSYQSKNLIFKNKKVLKGTGIVIKEDLTIVRHQLLDLAVKKFGFRNVWTSDGNIVVFYNNKKTIVRSQEDLPQDYSKIQDIPTVVPT